MEQGNRRGAALGCLGIILVLVFFIGTPILIYFTFFGPVGEEGAAYWVERAEDAFAENDYDLTRAMLDSSRMRGETLGAYVVMLQLGNMSDTPYEIRTAMEGIILWEGDGGKTDVLRWALEYLYQTDYERFADKGFTAFTELSTEKEVLDLVDEQFWGSEREYGLRLLMAANIVHPTSTAILTRIAEYFENEEDYRAVVRVYEKLLEVDDANVGVLEKIGYALLRNGNPERAKQYLQQASGLGSAYAEEVLDALDDVSPEEGVGLDEEVMEETSIYDSEEEPVTKGRRNNKKN